MSDKSLVEQWEKIQRKTFTGWVNMHLGKRGLTIKDIVSDMKDGVKLLALLEVISDESVGKYNKTPKMKVQIVENLNRALQFIAQHDVKLVNIGATELGDGNEKLWLGMIWTIILRFAIAGLSEEGLSAKEGLLLWVQRKTKGYKGVNVQDFTVSFQDGLAFNALIHRHRPDLLNFDELTNVDKLGNLNKAFDVCAEHLSIPKLLDAEDIVNIARPDERSIMTYVAAMYKVFSSLDSVETAGRRITKFGEFAKTTAELIHDYEERTRKLKGSLHNKVSELDGADLASDVTGARHQNAEFKEYKKTQKRAWITEQADLSALFTQIQAKLKSMNRPLYVPPEGLSVPDVEHDVDTLTGAERKRRAALNANLRQILDGLRKAFATPANAFAEKLSQFKSALANLHGELEHQLQDAKAKRSELDGLHSLLPELEETEAALDSAGVEDNEFTDYTYDDLSFEYQQLKSAYSKAITAIEGQIAEKNNTGVSAEQLAEFKRSFDHFDKDKNGTLSKLEFKSALSGLGLIDVSFESGQDQKFESIFSQVSKGADHVTYDNYVEYMVATQSDTVSPDQLRDSFSTVAGGKDFVTENDFRVAGLEPSLIEYFKSALPQHSSGQGYDYKAYLAQN